MPRAAPRICTELRTVIALAPPSASAAEVCRLVGAAAERLELTRPSYEQVRVLLIDARLRRPRRHVSATELLVDVAFRARPPTDIDAWLAGTPLPYRPAARNEPQD